MSVNFDVLMVINHKIHFYGNLQVFILYINTSLHIKTVYILASFFVAEKQLSMLGNRNLSEVKRYKLTGSFKEGFHFTEDSDAKKSDTCVEEISEDAANLQKLWFFKQGILNIYHN